MSPRFRRYLLRSLPVLALLLLLTWGLTWASATTGQAWLRFSYTTGLITWLVMFGMKWATRTDPQKRD